MRLGEDGPAGRTGEAGAACGELLFKGAGAVSGDGDFVAAVLRWVCGEVAGDTPGDADGLPSRCSCLCGELRCECGLPLEGGELPGD